MAVECSKCGEAPALSRADRFVLSTFGAVATTCPNCEEFALFETDGFGEEADDA